MVLEFKYNKCIVYSILTMYYNTVNIGRVVYNNERKTKERMNPFCCDSWDRRLLTSQTNQSTFY